MAKEIECEQCGNCDFIQESGFYYCTQCQTQTQEIQEHVFEDNFHQDHQDDQQNPATPAAKTAKKDNQRKKQEQNNLTTWECWNIVLKALVDELIQLGADEKLKPVVKNLWMSYLEKLQVFNFTKDQLPRVQLVNSVRDTAILFGTKKRKRRRLTSAQSSSDESQSASTSTIKRQMAKKKRALAEAHYENSQKLLNDSTPLADETLQSIQSVSDTPKETKQIKFNKYALEELKRASKSKKHITVHKKDIYRDLHCHVTYLKTAQTYHKGPTVLSQSKIFCLLYIGLLIIEDKITLSDLLRFINEGHLDFKSYRHLFTEDFTEKNVNIAATVIPPSSHQFRKKAAKLVHFLGITRYIQGPNLRILATRYCKELNLPTQITEYVCKVIIKSKPRLIFNNSSSEIPNYEGRVMSLIIFVLKLFFGLDNVTEFKFSYFAHLLNSKKLVKQNERMFDIIKWLKYIEYRRLFISEHHFPTNYQLSNVEIDSDLFIKHIKEKNIQFERSKRRIHQDFTDILQGILDIQENDEKNGVDVEFPPTLTPFYDYTNILLHSDVINGKKYMLELLQMDFTGDSLNFLTKSANYLPLVTTDGTVPVKNGGANDKWLIKTMENYRMLKQKQLRHKRKLICVQYGNLDMNLEQFNETTVQKNGKSDNIDVFFDNYQQANKHRFEKNRAKDNISTNNNDSSRNPCEDAVYEEHYCPFERYWMNFEMYIDWDAEEIVDKYFNQFTNTYKIIFKDCARIIEQSVKQLLHEYQMTEVYLVYLSDNLRIDQFQSCTKGDLKTLIEQSKKHW